MATTTTSTVVAFVLGAAAGTGGTIAATTYSGETPPNVVCGYDAAVDAIMCKVDPVATTEAAPVPVNQ